MPKIKILTTSPLTSPERTILSESQFDLTQESFIQIKSLNFDFNPSSDLLIFTSKNAVRSVLKNEKIKLLKQTKCICVGEKTQELLIENGFEVLDFTHYAEDLTHIITEKYSDTSFTFFCGNLRRDVLPNFFKKNNIKFQEVQVYKNELSPQRMNEKFDGILFFSPSAIHSFLQENKITDEICFCIGTTTSEELKSYTNNIILSEKPTITSVLEKVKNHYLKNKK